MVEKWHRTLFMGLMVGADGAPRLAFRACGTGAARRSARRRPWIAPFSRNHGPIATIGRRGIFYYRPEIGSVSLRGPFGLEEFGTQSQRS